MLQAVARPRSLREARSILGKHDRAVIIADMASYMGFAWSKAEDHRGLSSARSISKMQAWLWLLGDDELYAYASGEGNYPQYGAPILARISAKYGFAVPQSEGLRRMIKGLPCVESCKDGCGR